MSMIDVYLVMRVVHQISMEWWIGVLVDSIMNFILQVRAQDINHQLSVRKYELSFYFTSLSSISVVIGIGDPHIRTIDNGRYTCHIQGLFVFSRTTDAARRVANLNMMNDAISGSNILYPEDLFYVHVRSAAIPPALPYVERSQGQASIFTGYTIGSGNYTFTITNINGKFGKKIFEIRRSDSHMCLSQVLSRTIKD